MSDRLQELNAFVRTAQTGSFSRTAREMGLTQPSVSRLVGALEARLGIKLLLRSTRNVVPTDAGTAFLGRVQDVLHELEAAEDFARGIDSLSGTIRVAMPVTFGTREVIPRLPGFLSRHPQLRLEMLMSDDYQDLIAEGVDLAIRLGKLANSGFGVRRLTTAPVLFVASPAYIATHGMPRTPSDLTAHKLAFIGGKAQRSWTFQHNGAQSSVYLEARLVCNSAEGCLACVKAGLGIGAGSWWLWRSDLAAGSVVPLLEQYQIEFTEAYAIFPGGPKPSAKVRALVDHLAAEFALPQANYQKP